MPNFVEFLPVDAEFFHAKRQMHRWTDMKKLIVYFFILNNQFLWEAMYENTNGNCKN
jgi:hypothetical protein